MQAYCKQVRTFLFSYSYLPHSTLSSYLVTLTRTSTSSLRIVDRSFQCAFLHLWNQLAASFCQPCTNLFDSDSYGPMSGASSMDSVHSALSSSITPLLFHSRLKLKPSFSANHSHRSRLFFFRTDSMDSLDCLPILLSEHILSISTF